MIEKPDLVKSIEWVKKQVPIVSPRELTLGYVIGFLEAYFLGIVSSTEKRTLTETEQAMESNQLRGIIRRRVPLILANIETILSK
jgi:hypothetical protein